MKTLALLRHAKSSWDDPALRDFDRPLAPRGIDAARRMGAEMRRRALAFDLVLASPARRVVETLDHVEEGFGQPLGADFRPEIYEASAPALLVLATRLASQVERLLLVGHSPALQQLAIALAAEHDPLFRELADRYPTAALAIIELPQDSWNDVQPGTRKISAYLKPRELAAA